MKPHCRRDRPLAVTNFSLQTFHLVLPVSLRSLLKLFISLPHAFKTVSNIIRHPSSYLVKWFLYSLGYHVLQPLTYQLLPLPFHFCVMLWLPSEACLHRTFKKLSPKKQVQTGSQVNTHVKAYINLVNKVNV